MVKKYLVIGSIILILLLGLNGCVEEKSKSVLLEDHDRIVGMWQLNDGFGSIIFFDNGTGTNGPWKMVWQMDEETLIVNTTFNETVAVSIFNFYFYEDDTMLELIDEDSKQELMYRRV